MLYVRLFHGRTDPEQDMDDWGSDGPIFGPYKSVHTTYACRVKMIKADGSFDELLIHSEDLVFYNGVYYGDWIVFDEPDLHKKEYPITLFDAAKALLPVKKVS